MSLVLSRIDVKINRALFPTFNRGNVPGQFFYAPFVFFLPGFFPLFFSFRFMNNTGLSGLLYYHKQFSFISLDFEFTPSPRKFARKCI